MSTDTMHIMMDIVHPLNIYSSPHPLTIPTPLFKAEDSFVFFGHIVFFLSGIVEVTVVCPDVASFLPDTCLCRAWIFAKNLCLYISALCRDFWKLHILVEHSFTALYSTHAACSCLLLIECCLIFIYCKELLPKNSHIGKEMKI